MRTRKLDDWEISAIASDLAGYPYDGFWGGRAARAAAALGIEDVFPGVQSEIGSVCKWGARDNLRNVIHALGRVRVEVEG